MTTTATIHDPERKGFWLETLGTDTVPVVSIVPIMASTPKNREGHSCYLLDIQKLTDEQQNALLDALAKKFDLPADIAKKEFYENGVPIPAEDVMVASSDIGLLYSLMDDDEIRFADDIEDYRYDDDEW